MAQWSNADARASTHRTTTVVVEAPSSWVEDLAEVEVHLVAVRSAAAGAVAHLEVVAQALAGKQEVNTKK